MRIGDYEYEEIDYIESGGYGTVYRGRHIKTTTFVAIKLIKNFETDERVKREVDILKNLEHENVVELFYYEESRNSLDMRNASTECNSGESHNSKKRALNRNRVKRNLTVQGDKLYLVMEFFPDGDLKKMIENQVISEAEIKNFLKQMVAGLSYINSKNIVHRDIKPANILVKKSAGKVIYKLTDFGISKLIFGTHCMTKRGTINYMAPEIIKGKPANFKADVYSLGITIFVMMNQKIENPTLRDLYDKMTKEEPGNRYTIDDVRNHPFLK